KIAEKKKLGRRPHVLSPQTPERPICPGQKRCPLPAQYRPPTPGGPLKQTKGHTKLWKSREIGEFQRGPSLRSYGVTHTRFMTFLKRERPSTSMETSTSTLVLTWH